MTDFRCPRCAGELVMESPDGFYCPADRLTFERIGGIWRFLTPETAARVERFIREYETIRRMEGRASADPDYYRRLPETDRNHPLAGMWRFRAAGFRCFERNVLRKMADRPLRIADLGSGPGWLANRLARDGHVVDAVDLLDNDWDGLGAQRHYETQFRPVRASFDELPYRPGLFDLIVFNASFHYSPDYAGTLRRVKPLLNETGSIAILDTPVYHRAESGQAMVAEREREFTERYGFPSNALAAEHFLTYQKLDQLAAEFGLQVRRYTARYPLRRRLEPLLARLRGRREPAAFPVIRLEETSR